MNTSLENFSAMNEPMDNAEHNQKLLGVIGVLNLALRYISFIA